MSRRYDYHIDELGKFSSHAEFVDEVFATREDMIAWDAHAREVNGGCPAGDRASLFHILERYDMVIESIEERSTMDEIVTARSKDGWRQDEKIARKDGASEHPLYHKVEEIRREAFETDLLFGPNGRTRELEIANEYSLAVQQYRHDLDDGPLRDGLGWSTKAIDDLVWAARIHFCRFKFEHSRKVLQFLTGYSDALFENQPLNKRVRRVYSYMFSPQSIGTPVCLYYEHLDGGKPSGQAVFTSF